MKAEDNPFPYITLVEQASAPATPSAGKAKLWRGTDNKDYVLDDTGASTEFPGTGGSTTEILATVSYNPATTATYGPFTTNAETDIDATNLAITFTAPSSGKVEVFLDGLFNYTQTSLSQGNWCLRSGTTLIASAIMSGNSVTASFSTGNARKSIAFKITGLTPGTSYTYKWAWRAFPSSTLKMFAGGSDVGAAYMRVTALP